MVNVILWLVFIYTCSFCICVFISWRDLFQTDGIHAICMRKFLAIKLEYLQMCTNQHWLKLYGMIALKSVRYSRHKQTCNVCCCMRGRFFSAVLSLYIGSTKCTIIRCFVRESVKFFKKIQIKRFCYSHMSNGHRIVCIVLGFFTILHK